MLEDYFLLVRRISGLGLSIDEYWELDSWTTAKLLDMERQIIEKEQEDIDKSENKYVEKHKDNSKEMNDLVDRLSEDQIKMLYVEVDNTGFYNFYDSFTHMATVIANTLSNFSRIVEMNSKEYVPLDTGDLENSYFWKVVENKNFVELDVGYSVESENGYDYSLIQHERDDFKHPRRGTSKFLVKGISDSTGAFFFMLETDFASLFGR